MSLFAKQTKNYRCVNLTVPTVGQCSSLMTAQSNVVVEFFYHGYYKTSRNTFYLFGSRATVMFSQRHFHLNGERDFICSFKICVFLYVPNGYVRLGLADNLELDTASTYFFIFSLKTDTVNFSLFDGPSGGPRIA